MHQLLLLLCCCCLVGSLTGRTERAFESSCVSMMGQRELCKGSTPAVVNRLSPSPGRGFGCWPACGSFKGSGMLDCVEDRYQH
jgi:hypothetical protein